MITKQSIKSAKARTASLPTGSPRNIENLRIPKPVMKEVYGIWIFDTTIDPKLKQADLALVKELMQE